MHLGYKTDLAFLLIMPIFFFSYSIYDRKFNKQQFISDGGCVQENVKLMREFF